MNLFIFEPSLFSLKIWISFIYVIIMGFKFTRCLVHENRVWSSLILHPENKRMKDIVVDECKIQGVAIKVIKDLEN